MSEGKRDNPQLTLPTARRIFVNRSLNFSSIRLIGFDMDHTLVPYNRKAFEALAFRQALHKLIEDGYPEELRQLSFRPRFAIRGLLVDTVRGNLLKVDGHKYVKDAYHGYRRLTKYERRAHYNAQSFSAAEFVSIDTLFGLSEVQLYAEIIDYMLVNPGRINKTFAEVYTDVRSKIDLSHADGSIKNEVVRYPDKYIERDPNLAPTLRKLVEADKSIFLLTNSQEAYTEQVMSYAFDGLDEDFPKWQDYWDVVIVGASKPGFFTGNQAFLERDQVSNELVENSGQLDPERIYHGGNASLFEELTGYKGDEVLYVGDHIYGDIIRSKDALNWRTLLIIEELGDELNKIESLPPFAQVSRRVGEREVLDEKISRHQSKIAVNTRLARQAEELGEERRAARLLAENSGIEKKIAPLRKEIDELDLVIKVMLLQREAAVHPVWGPAMRVGLEYSRFAEQVRSYACLYTSRVSNMRHYSPFKRFVSRYEIMPHDSVEL